MKAVCLFALLVAIGANASVQKVSPVQKVIELLDNLKGKVAADLAAEEKEMIEYTKYCDDTASEKGYAIRTAAKEIERLQAQIEDGQAQIAGAETEIAELGSATAKKETELANAVKLRKGERADFKKTETSLVKAEDELQAAEVIVKREMAFVQIQGKKHTGKPKFTAKGMKAITDALSKVIDSTTVVSSKAKAKLQGFMQAAQSSSDEDKDLQMPGSEAPAADEYENHSGGILGTIKDLEVKDEDQLSATRKGEMQEQHSFDMMRMSMEDAINLLKKKIADATAAKAQLQEQVGAANGELAETEKNKAADEAFLKALTSDCTATATAWEARKKSAAEEMGAIDKAKEILATGVKALVQVSSKKATKDDGDDAQDAQDAQRAQIQKVLRGLGRKYNSFAMMEVASAAGSDPFAKIKGLIGDMISKLMDEAAQEADHKAFCDKELGKSRKSKNDKARKMDQYRTRIDEAATTKAELEEAVKELQGEVADLDKGQAEATTLRGEEHATFLKASSDYKSSAEAVEKAMAVLSEYYGKSFVQVEKASKKGKQPEFGSKTGGDTASTILSILEVSASDFTKLLAETEAAEAEAQAAYEKLSDDNKVSKAAKLAEVKGKTSEIKSLTVALAHHNEDYKMVEKEYGAVMEYLDKLKPECESKVMSYAEKKQRRENEIEGLKEALSIVEGTGVPAVQGTELIQRH